MSNSSTFKTKVKNFFNRKGPGWYNKSLKSLYKQVMAITMIIGVILLVLAFFLNPQPADTQTGVILISISAFMYCVGFLFGVEGSDYTLRKQSEKEAKSVSDNRNPQS